MAGRKRGAASRAAKGAKKKKASATKYAADRRRAQNGKEWKPSTKSLDTRSAELLASAEIESTAAKLILARQAVMLSDAVEVTYHQTVLKQVELRQVSAMVSAHKQLMNVLEILGIATADDRDGDPFDDLGLMDPEPPRNNVVKTTHKRATKKKAKKKKKKVAKKKSSRRTIDDDVDALMGN